MRTVEAFVANPFFGLFVALVLAVIAPKLSPRGENLVLLVAWCLFAFSVFRTRPISIQSIIPRVLLTLLLSSLAGLGLCLLVGWRPSTTSYRLSLIAISGSADYPPGTNMGGIAWSNRFSDLRVVLENDTETDFKDIDLILKPDIPVAVTGQVTNIPDVTFSSLVQGTFRQELIEGKTGKRIVNPLVLIASDGGYRMRCKVLPKKGGRLEVIIAAAEVIDFPKPGTLPIKPDGGIFDRDYVLKLETKDKKTNETANNWYGRGVDTKGRIEEVYKKDRRIPKTVEINGQFTAEDEEQAVSRKIEARDAVGEILRQKLEFR